MRLALIGPPGSGKGTQAKRLAARFGLATVGTGDMVRDAIRSGTPAGLIAGPLIRRGVMVPDAVINDAVAERFRRPDRPDSFVLDGYPRTPPQAAALDALLRQEFLALDAVLSFEMPDDEAVRRVAARRICPAPECGATYHLDSAPPARDGVCDVCGTTLVVRDDDRPEAAARRLSEFRELAGPLLAHYERRALVRAVDATGAADDVFGRVLAALPAI